MGGVHPQLTSQNSLGSGHRLQVPRLSFPDRVGTDRGLPGGAHAAHPPQPPAPGWMRRGHMSWCMGQSDVMLHRDPSRD